MREITQQGINALKAGDRAAAFRLLAGAVRQDPNDVQAWLWLSGAVDNDKARIDCMRQVLRIEPDNAAAANGLVQLLEKQKQAAAAPVETPPQRQKPAESKSAQAGARIFDRPPETSVAGELAKPSPVSTPLQPQTNLEIDAMRAVYEQPAVAAPEDITVDQLAAPEALAAEERLSEAGQHGDVENIGALAPGTTFYRPMARPGVTYANYDQRIIFRIRPSQVPALISFWIFFFGAYFVGSQFTEKDFMFGMFLGFGLGIALELVIIYMVITNFRTRYTLTNEELRMHFVVSDMGLPYARDITIPLDDIYNAECRQNFLQQLMGIGDLHFDAAVEGQLGHMRLRGIPQCDHRVQQIMYLVREHQEPYNVFSREVS